MVAFYEIQVITGAFVFEEKTLIVIGLSDNQQKRRKTPTKDVSPQDNETDKFDNFQTHKDRLLTHVSGRSIPCT